MQFNHKLLLGSFFAGIFPGLGTIVLAGTGVDTVRIQDRRFNLVSKNSHCMVEYDRKLVETGLTGICFFVSNGTRVTTYKYRDANIDAIFLIGGDTVSKADRKSELWNWASEFKECGTGVVALLLRKGRLFLSAKIPGRQVCTGLAVDEKEFWAAAHELKPEQLRGIF